MNSYTALATTMACYTAVTHLPNIAVTHLPWHMTLLCCHGSCFTATTTMATLLWHNYNSLTQLPYQHCCHTTTVYHDNTAVVQLPWQHCCDKTTMAKLLCHNYHGNTAVTHLPWQHCYDNTTMATLLWHNNHGISVVTQLPWLYSILVRQNKFIWPYYPIPP